MYISQNLRQSWYGNLLGDEENDEDQDALKVPELFRRQFHICLFFLLQACISRN